MAKFHFEHIQLDDCYFGMLFMTWPFAIILIIAAILQFYSIAMLIIFILCIIGAIGLFAAWIYGLKMFISSFYW